ncbi:hypothetical protein ACIBSV_04735 [Embleya sp. NPDC050154]|uniref:hypothetical protein n=1 Tax=unclassified Embleya TaxID=2699296 RepID=UPI0037A48E64|nr:hypothetical protein OG948_28445 [Embleya sp. NBC_00888]
MSRYYVQYSDRAEDGLKPLSASQIRAFKSTVESTVGNDPYGHGSSQVGSDRDRREATVTGVFIRYMVSNSVLVVSVTRAVSL